MYQQSRQKNQNSKKVEQQDEDDEKNCENGIMFLMVQHLKKSDEKQDRKKVVCADYVFDVVFIYYRFREQTHLITYI